MFKLLDNSEETITIIDLAGPDQGLVKAAAHQDLVDYVKTIRPKAGKSYLHINAMGAGEYYGSNRNGDYFPEAQLIEYHKTFETSPAHLFRHHINKDPKKANGVVLLAIYNKTMHRVELIVEADKSLTSDIEARIARGDYPATSMACKTPFDTCSICNNRAHTRAEYCSHLSNELNRVYTDGRRVMALNNGPLKFFDISLVVKPADPTSSILVKVAGEDRVIGSAEMADLENLAEGEKRAEQYKLSELVKEIRGDVVSSEALDNILNKTSDLPMSLAHSLSVFSLAEVLNSMATAGISPSIGFLAELIAPNLKGVGPVVEAMMSEIHPDTVMEVYKVEKSLGQNPLVDHALAKHLDSSSLLPAYVEKRASGIGYAGLGPHIEPLYDHSVAQPEQRPDLSSFLKTNYPILMALGGGALMAKWYINKEIEAKLQNNAKIVIIKQASDYRVASVLSKNGLPESNNDAEPVNSERLISKIIRRLFRMNKTTGKIAGGIKVGDIVYNVSQSN
jgi:hypothetical protein